MAIRYPNGRVYHAPNQSPKHKQGTAKVQPLQKMSFSNRGMRFEEAINQSNAYYLAHQMAVIHKKPTPVQIVTVDYPKRSAAVIKEAYFKEASTTDYNGVYQGYYLDFEAKETKNKTSFPFKNFHAHQIEHMEHCLMQQGLCFVLLWFSSLNRCFFLDSQQLIDYWHRQETLNKKSLPLALIEEIGIEIIPKIAPRIPYLDAVNQYLEQKGVQ
ncbi:MAG: Holliday junction resolvase RecU [Enterococcus sp.]